MADRPDPCPRCVRTSGDPDRSVIVGVREALERCETSIGEAVAQLRNDLQSALFRADDHEGS